MNSELNNALTAAGQIAQYDASAKRLLGQKSILAHILVKTVEDFKGMNPKEVEKYIEGDPYISVVPIELGLTNKEKERRKKGQGRNQVKDQDSSEDKNQVEEKCENKGSGQENDQGKNNARVVGFNTESEELNEGLIRFDIVFYVRLPFTSETSKTEPTESDFSYGELAQIIMNIEAQKDEPSEYDILNRAVFYVCRLISSQKERDFTNSNYNDLKRVYSIWVCMNTTENSMCHIHLTKDDLIGMYRWKGRLDLLNIVMIGLSKELPGHDETYDLHRLLGALLSQVLTSKEKVAILEKEYHIPAETHMRKDVSDMCNLGEGIEERGIKKGFERGIEQGEVKESKRIILNMHRNGFSEEQIASATDKDIKDVRSILSGKKPSLV